MPTHPYRLKNGKRVSGVTTINGRWKSSDALLIWNYHQGYKDAEAGLAPNPHRAKEEAGGVGTYVHALFEWHLNGYDGPEPDPGLLIVPEYRTIENIERGRLGFKNAVEWHNNTQLVITSWEQPLVSERLKVGGTPDGTTERRSGPRRFGLADWKSSKRVYYEYLIQLAGYWLIWEENFPESPINNGVHIVRFSKVEGDFAHFYFDQLDREKRQFIRYVEAYEDDKLIKERV